MSKFENQTMHVDLDKLVNKLKKVDDTNRKSAKFVKTVYWSLFPLIAFLLVVNIIEKDIPQMISLSCISIAFFIIIWVSNSTYKKYKAVDYSLPTIELLGKYSKKRKLEVCKFLIGILIGLAMMDIGIINTSLPYNISVLNFQLFYWGIIIVGFVTGIIVWYIKYRTLGIEVKRVLKDIEE